MFSITCPTADNDSPCLVDKRPRGLQSKGQPYEEGELKVSTTHSREVNKQGLRLDVVICCFIAILCAVGAATAKLYALRMPGRASHGYQLRRLDFLIKRKMIETYADWIAIVYFISNERKQYPTMTLSIVCGVGCTGFAMTITVGRFRLTACTVIKYLCHI